MVIIFDPLYQEIPLLRNPLLQEANGNEIDTAKWKIMEKMKMFWLGIFKKQ